MVGVRSGLAGVVALEAFEALERRALGAPPVYASEQIAGRFARRLGWRAGPRARRRLGRLLRVGYGAALGVLRAAVAPRGRLAGALGFAAAIYGFELIVLPASGATPPLATWRRGQPAWLAAHTLAFAVGATLFARRRGVPRRS